MKRKVRFCRERRGIGLKPVFYTGIVAFSNLEWFSFFPHADSRLE